MTDRLRQAGRLLVFLVWYVGQLLRANGHVITDVLTPGSRVAPGFLELPLRCRTDLEITTIANLISLTPGTVTVAVRPEPATIWVHGMYIHDVEAFRADLHEMEGRMLGALRPQADPGRVPVRAPEGGHR
jgi:multicomponent Na+:H+ antiporter subunit E